MRHHTSSRKTRIVVTALIALGFLLVTGSGVLARRSPFQPLTIFARALSTIELSYVEPVDQEKLVHGAIRGMADALDPHSVFLDPEEYAILEADAAGRFAGVGVEVAMRDGWLTILTVFDGGPADAAGLLPGDRFLTIDDEEARDIRLDEAVRKMRGEPGTQVDVTIRRDAVPAAIERTLRRAFIDIDPIHVRYLERGIVYIQVTTFQERTAELFREALDRAVSALRDTTGFRGLLLDLRDNGGGLLREAVLMSDEFLSGGVILTTRGRGGDVIREFSARRGGTRPKWPIVILINEQTASAAEIVAGALSDQKRAVLVGARTFGKGSVQSVFELPDASALKLTIALYYTPSGRSIQAEGIVPDVTVASPIKDEEPPPLREQDLDGHLEARRVGGEQSSSRARVQPVPEDAKPSAMLSDDPQAQRGYQILRQRIGR